MRDYTLVHLSDAVLLRELTALVVQDRGTTAKILAHLAEVDARRLYAPAGYPSMHAYCVEELRLSEDAASKRIQAARAARRFPALFAAVADGRLHLTAVRLLAPHLTPENAGELIDVATHRRSSEIEEWLARRFPLPGMPSSVRAISAHAPGHVGIDFNQDEHAAGHVGVNAIHDEHAAGHVGTGSDRDQHVPGHVGFPSPERFLVQVTIEQSTREKLRYAQALLSHAVPSGDVAQVLDRALDSLITQLEKRKLGAVSRQRTPRPESTLRRRSKAGGRYVPAHVRRAVWERDRGQCTFVSAAGHRCGARRFLEFDHVEPVARGGTATVEGMRLRCRAHNQYEAERVFGAGFVSRKRDEARLTAEEARVRDAEARAKTAAKEQTQDVLAGLRSLGCRADEARRAAEYTRTLDGVTLEERMRAAVTFLGRRSAHGGGARCHGPYDM